VLLHFTHPFLRSVLLHLTAVGKPPQESVCTQILSLMLVVVLTDVISLHRCGCIHIHLYVHAPQIRMLTNCGKQTELQANKTEETRIRQALQVHESVIYKNREELNRYRDYMETRDGEMRQMMQTEVSERVGMGL